MTLTNPQIAELLADLEQCGIHAFNVNVYDNGVVAFWSGGLTTDDIHHARHILAYALMVIASEAK